MKTRALLNFITAGLVFVSVSGFCADPPLTRIDFVDVKTVDRTILIDLRYASSNNFAHRPIYPSGTPALVRLGVAQRLVIAQKYLKARGYGLKIWDAYRPLSAQQQLWEATRNNAYVANPQAGLGSNHTRGVAIDATLVDGSGRDVPMPTDFDNFTPAAMLTYQGKNAAVRMNLNLLQKAMAHGGFYGLRTEWWHFCAPDWAKYPIVPEIKLASQDPRPTL